MFILIVLSLRCMGRKVRVAIAGVGNCASALVQGTRYYSHENDSTGLIAYSLAGIEPSDIEFVAAFDVADNKVGKDIAEGIFAEPNNTLKVVDVEPLGVKIEKGEVHDGIGRHLSDVVRVSDAHTVDVAQRLKDTNADVLINYLPVGSLKGTMYYAEQALKAGVGFINAIPVFIASDELWQERFASRGLPVAGDDVMSQLGATVLHKALIKLLVDRGVKVEHTYQLNIGGDADFYNMLDEDRLEYKRESKASAVRAMLPYDVPMRIGPSDYVGFLNNEKVCYIYIKGRYFCNVPLEINVKLNVIDAYNSAGVMIDAVRAMKVALDRGVAGSLISVSAYCFKHPPLQMPYNDAKHAFMEFIEGKRER
jgi:myo-inositol-1-phosphate synthase